MKIRCKSCYRVLNHDEEYCTRCGERSLEVVKLMNGEILDDAIEYRFKTNIWLYLGIAFLLNGVLSIILSVFFQKANPDLLLTNVGTALPQTIAYFSFSNATLSSGIILTGVLLITFYKEIITQIKKDLKVLFQIKMFSHLFFILLISIFLLILIKITDVTIIPSYFKSFLAGELLDVYKTSNGGIFKICITLIMYSFIIEYIFKYILYAYLDETTLFKEGTIISIMIFTSVLAEFLTFGFTSSLTIQTLLYWILGSFVFNYILSIWYTISNKNLLLNIIIRVILTMIVILFI